MSIPLFVITLCSCCATVAWLLWKMRGRKDPNL